MQGLVQRLQGEFTDDTLKRFYPNDAMLSQYTIFMFDMKNAATYAGSRGLVGAGGLTINNLVSNAAPAVVGNGATLDAQSIKYPATGGSNINMGTNYDLGAMGVTKFALSIWVKFPTGTEENTNSYQRLIGRHGITTVGQWQAGIDTGSGGKSPRAMAGSSTVIATKGVNSVSTLDVVQNLIMVLDSAGVSFYRDGASQGGSSAFAGPLISLPANIWQMGAWANGRVFRWSLENLTNSPQTGAQFAAAEFAKNTGRFS